MSQVLKAAAEDQRRAAKRGGLEELSDHGPKPGDVRQRLIHRDPGWAMKWNLGVGQDETRNPLSVDEGEFASNPAARVIADERIEIDAEFPEHPLESSGLPLRGIVVIGGAVRLSQPDQIRCVTGKAISKVRNDLVPCVPRQGKTVQEDYRGSNSIPAPVNRCLSDPRASLVTRGVCVVHGLRTFSTRP